MFEINKNLLEILGYDSDIDVDKLRKDIIKNSKNISKPCEKLNYCPYGYLVELFPLLPTTKEKAQKNYNHIENFINIGEYKGDHLIRMQNRLKSFDISKHPEKIPANIKKLKCPTFGHLCPVYFCKGDL